MKNIPVLLVLIFIWALGGGTQSYAQFLQGPNEPYPPVLSEPLDVLPKGFITINIGNDTFYYCSGIFYQKIMQLQLYVVVPPPIGAVVFNLPRGYQLMLIDGIIYYEYQNVYYKRTLAGFKVIYPPV